MSILLFYLSAKKMNTKIEQQDIFTYSVRVTVPANSETTSSFNIESDSSFKWIQTSRFIVGQTPVAAMPDFDVEVKDTGTGRFLQQNPVNIGAMAGTAELPHILPRPRTFAASSQVSTTFTNNTGSPITAVLYFQGLKTWVMG